MFANLSAESFRKVQIGMEILSGSLLTIGGVILGAALSTKKLEEYYAALSDKEIAEAKDYYSTLYKTDVTLEDLAAKHVDIDKVVSNYKPVDQVEEVTITIPAEAPVNNVFHHVWDLENEMLSRGMGRPYVISKDEWNANDDDYDMESLTYFEPDDVLMDTDTNTTIEDTEAVVGNSNLLRFGHGSNDSNIVYVQNDRLGIIYEITRSTSTFAETVHGYIEHSDRPVFRKFRQNRE